MTQELLQPALQPPPWDEVASVPVASGDSHDPALAVVDGAVHLVWAQDRLLHHARFVDGAWQEVTRLVAGEQPVLSAGRDGVLHCIYASWFLGNCEIYHITFDGARWGFPEWVSRTEDVSTEAAIAMDAEGEGRIVWSEQLASEPLIYYARRGQVAWLHGPIPNAHGARPSVAVTPAGEVHVAWQDRIARIVDGEAQPGPFQVLSATLKDGQWSLPELVSEDPDSDALAPSLAAAADGSVHITWQQQRGDRFATMYSIRLADGWSRSGSISDGEADARLPRAHANAAGVHVLWAEGPAILHRKRGPQVDAPWSDIETVASDAALSQLAATLTSEGDLHLVWSAYETDDRRCIRYTKLNSAIQHEAEQKTYLPIVGGGKKK